jgi:hypothetical protein
MRPRASITDETRRIVRHLASLGLSHEDIAITVRVSRRTLERRCAADLEAGRAQMRGRLHKIQWTLAEKSPTMAIWLGKQYLGQRDVPLPADQQGAVIEYVHRVITTTATDSSNRNPALGAPATVRTE